MISYIHSTTVLVTDQDKALDFYTNVLGFEKREDQNYGDVSGRRWLTVAPKGEKGALALVRPQDTGNPEAKPGGYSGVSMVTDDIDRLYEELSAKGVQFQGPPQQMPWGAKSTWFSDPDGNSFFITNWQG